MNKNMLNLGTILVLLICIATSCPFFGESAGNYDKNKVSTGNLLISTPDGLNISIQYLIPKTKTRHPAVILLHMLGKEDSSWNSFIPKLLDNGYAIYNMDLRGHGRSTRLKNGHGSFLYKHERK